MTYLSDKLRARRRYQYYALLFVVLASLSYFWPAVRTTLYPYLEGVVAVSGDSKNVLVRIPANIATYFTSRKDLESRNKALSRTIEHLENELAETKAMLGEQETKVGSGIPSAALSAYPLMSDVTTIYDSLILSKGFKDGVAEHDLVYIRGRQPVCTIIEINDQTSLCRLLTAHGEITEGVTASSSMTLYLKGDGGGAFVAEVPRDTAIAIGDSVLFKSIPSMTLGTVVDIVRNDQAVAWRVYVRGAYNPVTTSVFYINK